MHHQLKKVLHPNRYFIWAIFALVFSGAALLSYIYISGYYFDRDFVFAELKTNKLFLDNQFNYSARYPHNWQLERDEVGNIVFENPDNLSESLVVVPLKAKDETAVRKALRIVKENNTARGDIKIAIIKGSIDKDPEIYDIALITDGKGLFYIYGHSSWISRFVRNFNIQ
ncbi:MAG: hypothetical protein ACYC5G_04965 [Candidatus Doudnabacteria bacterium]